MRNTLLVIVAGLVFCAAMAAVAAVPAPGSETSSTPTTEPASK